MSGKMICPHCRGNGYVKRPIDEGRTEEIDCQLCDSQGEVEINAENLDELKYNNRLQ